MLAYVMVNAYEGVDFRINKKKRLFFEFCLLVLVLSAAAINLASVKKTGVTKYNLSFVKKKFYKNTNQKKS